MRLFFKRTRLPAGGYRQRLADDQFVATGAGSHDFRIGQSFAGTGSTLWGVGVVGSLHIGRVISWNGIVTYGAMAMGAPLGVLCYAWGGLQGLALTVMGVALLAVLLAFHVRR